MKRRNSYLLAEVCVPLLVVAGVWLFTENSRSFYFPALGDVLRAFRENWLFSRWGSDVLPSLARLLAGFALAVTVGVALGVLLGRSPGLRRQASPVIAFLRALPPPALIPLSILVLGIGSGAKVLLIAFACLWPVLLNTMDGMAGMEPTIRETGRVYRIGRWDSVLRVELPAAAPKIFSGMRTSLPLALVLMVISEMVASTNGIGYFILQAQRTYDIADMWSGILLLGVIGYLLSAAFTVVERRVLAWHRGARALVP